MVVLKEMISTVSTLGGYGVFDKTDLYLFILWEGVVVLKEMIFY